jgi:hypothetical protein
MSHELDQRPLDQDFSEELYAWTKMTCLLFSMDLRQELSTKVLFWGRNLRQQLVTESFDSELAVSEFLLNFFFKIKRFSCQCNSPHDFQVSHGLQQHAGHPLLVCLILQNLASFLDMKTQLLKISDTFVLQFTMDGYPHFVAPQIACGFLSLNDFQKMQKKDQIIALRSEMIHPQNIADHFLKEVEYFLPAESTSLRLQYLDLKIKLHPMDSGALIRRGLLKGILGQKKEAFLDFKKASYISRFDQNPPEVQNYFKELAQEFDGQV